MNRLDWFVEKMGYNNRWKFVQSLIWDVGMIAVFWYFATVVSDLTLVCPNGSEGFVIGNYNLTTIENVSLNLSIS